MSTENNNELLRHDSFEDTWINVLENNNIFFLSKR